MFTMFTNKSKHQETYLEKTMKNKNGDEITVINLRLSPCDASILKENWRYDLTAENKSDYIRNAIRFYSNHIAATKD